MGPIQIELVGFAGKPKDHTSLFNLARLCRWIEQQHAVARVWPMEPPSPPVTGAADPHRTPQARPGDMASA